MPQWLTIFLALGGSALITSIVSLIINKIAKSATESAETDRKLRDEMVKTNELIREGVQALLRDKLYEIHARCVSRGYATIDEKNNFENLYMRYHGLGKNGVMDSINEEMMELPTQEGKNR